ncbi:hypothetical protein Ate02nite_15600 [Paractinoplanes tereljensis]|uniref:HTH tetR-type domain-containing protein n=1 Tax=Paractinoplanes tereljensis TaxID=571912 RepID=A0A919TRY1_9ACTN|nr:TetR/AcrR family transcriptional regulator [Actinoplanes tereljensis]GIF18830.1 hypothetical protein Ate02nite_15600 [Actinoplanes tereljensis]
MSELRQERRRPRSDGIRSREAILAAAMALLCRRADVTVDEIASAAGVSRQTAYVHYPSRETLLRAVNDRLGTEAAAVLDPVEAMTGPVTEILARWLEGIWELVGRYPLLLSPALASLPACEQKPLTSRCFELLERGRHAGEIDSRTPTSWMVLVIMSLGYAAAQQVASRELTADEAGHLFRDSALRVCLPGR